MTPCFRPFDQISVVRYVTAQIVVQLLVDVHQGRRDLHIRLHGEAQTVGLTYVVVAGPVPELPLLPLIMA